MTPSIELLRQPLQQGALALGLALSPTEADALLRYLEQVERWNRVYNLTAVRDVQDMLGQHLLDCLAVVPALRKYVAAHPVLRLLDVGSGAGLPAVVLAIMEPRMQVVSVDTVGKKSAFVQQVAGTLGLKNLLARHARVENLPETEPFDLITARAFSSLGDLTELTRKLLAPGGAWMAMKGHLPEEEISALNDDIHVFHVEQLNVPGMSVDRCLVWMRRRA